MSGFELGGLLSRSMAMDEKTWRRHANPWSVWTRVPILPLLALAIFSRTWIGWWCLVPIALLVAWTFVNPRAFPPPAHARSWSARGTMGERIWLARREVPIPRHHERALRPLMGAIAVGVAILAYGLWALDGWATTAGTVLALGAKMWFVDRMAWLFDEMSATHPHYPAWRP